MNIRSNYAEVNGIRLHYMSVGQGKLMENKIVQEKFGKVVRGL